MNLRITVLAISFFLSACGGSDSARSPGSERPNDWLLNAESDEQRFELLQRYLRGFDQPMWEVGERYSVMFAALERGNRDLARYHWEKIRSTIQNGYLKRPARRANSERLFLDAAWEDVFELLSSGDMESAWQGFDRARDACMKCHVAELVAYINDQPVFELAHPAESGNGIDGN